jgi:general secretion pathway protein I
MDSELSAERVTGFTLIEAVVALLIVSLGMMAVYTQLNQYVSTAAYIQDKTLASWIATNRLTELSLDSTWPEVGDEEDEVEFAGRNWHYVLEVSETAVPNLHRADVSVSLAEDPDRVIQLVSALIEPPPPRGFVPPRWLSVSGAGRWACEQDHREDSL